MSTPLLMLAVVVAREPAAGCVRRKVECVEAAEVGRTP